MYSIAFKVTAILHSKKQPKYHQTELELGGKGQQFAYLTH
jgi:hypothetical protein